MLASIKNFTFEVADQPADYWQWVKEGRYDHEWDAYDRYLRKDHTFVDVGAWVGSHSLYASETVTNLIAVEPDPKAFPILHRNLQVRGRANDAYCSAIAGYDGEIKLGSSDLGWSTTRANPARGGAIEEWHDDQTFVVRCTTLRKLCAGLPDPLFIKLDVEGSEEDIIKDFEFFRERKPTLLIEFHPFWWKNEVETWNDVEQLKRLYPAWDTVHGAGQLICYTPSR